MQNKNSMCIPLNKSIFTVVDVETTGLSAAKNRIIEIALVKVENLKITEKYHTLINPLIYIPYFITNLTGITNDDVKNSPTFDGVADKIINFIENSILTAHNFSFDSSFLRSEFSFCGRDFQVDQSLCTVKLARKVYPTLKSKSLGSVSRHLNLKNADSHRALGDAETTARILIKMIKELMQNENIQTVDELLSYQTGLLETSSLKIKKELQQDFNSLPSAPGIYYFTNKKGDIIYVGKAKSIKERVRSYFTTAAPRKASKIVKQAARLKFEITNSELTALLTEAETIKLINPKHNYQLKRYGNKYFIRITKMYAAPKVEIANHFDFDGNDYFGLFISRKRADTMLDFINRTFMIRECSDKEFSKGKACFMFDIHRCTAPCLNVNENISNHDVELTNVYEFLYGKNQFALNRLLNKMKEHSEKQQYEKAAEVKELVDFILDQTHKSSIVAEPVNKANVLFEIISKYSNDYVLMKEGKIFIKQYLHNKKDNFDQALDDYYENNINNIFNPSDEDLEKMKITLNWLIKNRNLVKAFYLKDYSNKQELYYAISSVVDKSQYFNETEIQINNDPAYDYNLEI
jgi:DNA polymerase-3 subunit epsilon